MEGFEILIKELHNERIRAEKSRQKANAECGEDIYINFCCWCNGQSSADRTSCEDFKQFLKEENIKLKRHKRYYLAKKYFNYKEDEQK